MRGKASAPAAREAKAAAPAAPNVFWRSVSIDSLRLQHPRFVPLPPEVTLAAAAGGGAGNGAPPAAATAARVLSATSPYVAQQTPAWAMLRRGVATTASMPELVGLRLQHYSAAAATGGGGGGRRRGGGRGGGQASADAERRRLAALARLTGSPLATPEELEAALQGRGRVVVVEPPHIEQSAAAAAAAAAANEAARVELFSARCGGDANDANDDEDDDDYCRALLLRAASVSSPEVVVRLAWGQAQEAAALEAVLRAFPRARLEEAGVFLLPPPPPSSLPGASLPAAVPMGASPDALLVHPPVQWTAEDLRAAAEAWAEARRRAEEGEDKDAERAARREATGVLLRRALERATALNDADSPLSWPLTPLSRAAGAPDARVQLELVLDAALEAARAVGASGSNGAESYATAASLLPPFVAREAVEVKNHSPFKLKGAGGGGGGGRSKARGGGWRLDWNRPVRAQRLADAPRAQWYLQAQAHAMCCGSLSTLVVSRCAVAGSRVFRLWADEGYGRALQEALIGEGGGGGEEDAAAAAAERRAALCDRTRRAVAAFAAKGEEGAWIAEVPPAPGTAPLEKAFV
jgi:hypothetical protein